MLYSSHLLIYFLIKLYDVYFFYYLIIKLWALNIINIIITLFV